MACFVDDAKHKFQRMTMCHMACDSTVELEAMAETIGVPIRHIYYRGTAQEHLDVCYTKRKLAIEFGAIEITTREMAGKVKERRESGMPGRGRDER